MSDAEMRLVAKIVETGDLAGAIKAGISADMFGNPIAKDMFETILRYHKEREHYGCIPSTRWMENRFRGTFLQLKVPETLSELCVEMRDNTLEHAIWELCQEVIDINETDPRSAMSKLRTEVLRLHKMQPKNTERILAEDAEEIIERARLRRDPDTILGVPFPWEELNVITQGIHNEDFIVIFGRPKCVVEGQRILSSCGEPKPIEESVLATAHFDQEQNIRWGACSNSYAGEKEAIRIKTEGGNVVEVGEDHPMLLPDLSFAPAGELQVGDFVGVARWVPEPEHPERLEPEKARLLGLLVGDGNYTRNEVQFSKEDEGVIRSLDMCCIAIGAKLTHNEKHPDQYRIVGDGKENPVLDWLRELGCHGQKSEVKRVPSKLFRCSNASIAAFLSGYTDTDGVVHENTVRWTTASEGLAKDIKQLLLRFGVTGTLEEVTTNYGTPAYTVSVFAQEQHEILSNVLELHHMSKKESLEKLLRTKNRERHDDSIPYSDSLLQEILAAKGEEPRRLGSGFSQDKLFWRIGRIGRDLLRKLAHRFDAPNLLQWADSDVRWEQVVSIEKLGKRRCWDISMEEGSAPTFVVENFITHNSLKSWLAAKIVSHAYLFGNCRVLVYSCEMSTALFEDRLACCIHELNYTQLKQGTLSDLDWQWYKSAIRALAGDEKKDAVHGRHRSIKFVSHLDDPRGGGVSHLMAKAEDFDPDLIVVDSFYKMKDDRTGRRSVNWEAQYGLTQDLKGVTQIMHIPLIGVTQRHRSKKEESEDEQDMGDIAYADAVGQEAEAVYRIKKESMLKDKTTTQLRVMLAGSRETAVGGFLLHAIPATKFELYGWLDDSGKLTTSPLGAPPPKNPLPRRSNTNVSRNVQVPSVDEIRSSVPRRN